MKKTLFILLAALVLICAVACSSSPEDPITGIEIDTTSFNIQIPSNATKVYFAYDAGAKEDDSVKVEISLEDCKAGSVVVELEAGTYIECGLMFFNNTTLLEDFTVSVFSGTKKPEADSIVVTEGELTPCYAETDPV